MFDVMLADNQKARKTEADGNYHRVSNEDTGEFTGIFLRRGISRTLKRAGI